jgi:hypothetical protein
VFGGAGFGEFAVGEGAEVVEVVMVVELFIVTFYFLLEQGFLTR